MCIRDRSSSTITRCFLIFLTIFLTFGLGSIITSSSTDTISFWTLSIGSVFTELVSSCSSVWTCAFTIPVINFCACFLLFSISFSNCFKSVSLYSQYSTISFWHSTEGTCIFIVSKSSNDTAGYCAPFALLIKSSLT